MRSFLWCLVLPAFLNCSGQNVVAGREKTKAEQLESSLPKWCQATCSKLQQCEEDAGCECSDDVCECTGVDEDCAEDCEGELSRWASGSEECAEIGERIKRCIDELGCEALGQNGGGCNPTAEERDACAEGEGEVDPPSGGPPSSSGGSISSGFAGSYTGPVATGGTAAVGGSASGGAPSVGGAAYGADGPGGNGYGNAGHGGRAEGGAGASGDPVTCDAQSASGQAGSSNSAALCEANYSECSDDHTYDFYCVKTSEYKSVCSCLVDGSLTQAFEWTESCPEVLQVNVACGWNLVSN